MDAAAPEKTVSLLGSDVVVQDGVGIGGVLGNTLNAVVDDEGVQLIVQVQNVGIVGHDLLSLHIIGLGGGPVGDSLLDGVVDDGIQFRIVQVGQIIDNLILAVQQRLEPADGIGVVRPPDEHEHILPILGSVFCA